MTNSADDIPQSERRRILIEERHLRTYHGHAQSAVDEDRGGRFAFSGSPTTVTGSSPISYPTQPAHSPWAKDACPQEPPLGFSVEEMEPVGEPFERDPPSTTAASAVEDGGGGPSDGDVSATSFSKRSKMKRRM
jgi:hypothetical protein